MHMQVKNSIFYAHSNSESQIPTLVWNFFDKYVAEASQTLFIQTERGSP